MMYQPQIKLESIEQAKAIEREKSYCMFKKRIYCPDHDFKFVYKCQHPDCIRPFLCRHEDCLESHFHEGLLTMSKFNNVKLRDKIEKVHKIMKNYSNLKQKAISMKIVVDSKKNSFADLFQEKEEFDKLCTTDLPNSKEILTIQKVRKVQELVQKEKSLMKNLAKFKNRFSETSPKVYSSQVTNFLTLNIDKFSWNNSKLLWSSDQQPSVVSSLLADKQKLLFLMIGEKKVIGSYFPSKYPSLDQQTATAPGSFIFLQEDKQKDEFVKFIAKQTADYHVLMNERLLIRHGSSPQVGDGVRSHGPHLSAIAYYLPTASYQIVERDKQTDQFCYSGQFRIKHFHIYQLTHQE